MNEEPMPDPESRFRGAQLWVRWDEAGGVEVFAIGDVVDGVH